MGSPRIWDDPPFARESCGKNRVAQLMRANGLYGIRQRRRWRSKASGERPGDVLNHLARDFRATPVNTKWVTDITYIPTGEHGLYLCMVLDLPGTAVRHPGGAEWRSGNAKATSRSS
jgi:putative transposase